MKKIVSVIILVFICACSSKAGLASDDQNSKTRNYINVYENINGSVMEIHSSGSKSSSIKDSKTLYENADAVVIAHVLSISGSSNINEVTGEYCYAYTMGEIEILKDFKGYYQPGQIVEYRRGGGILPFEVYIKGLREESRNKLLSNIDEKPAYVEQKTEGDISIEPGKTYLMYLTKTKYNIDGTISIVGLEGGLREIDCPAFEVPEEIDLNKIRIKNNFNQTWEFADSVYGLSNK
ncbi:MAG: hypothetical protein K6D92_01015 [Erysipelotrichaceae bacterium]|nr:hypothetical protein [Erysipelotrichaceae bacterium]